MNGKRGKHLGWLAFLALGLIAAVPGQVAAQQAVLYEIVENLDVVTLMTTGHRVSHWTGQGTAQAGTAFCPVTLLPPGATSCTITAFGTDDIDLATLETSFVVGRVWANIVAVANADNVVDAPEAAAFSGQITGDITILSPSTFTLVVPDLGKKKSLLGPSLPLIYVTNGKFFPDGLPTVRTTPETDTAGNYIVVGEPTASFDSVFRLPFKVAKDGTPQKPERGKNAYYLGDDGSLIKVDKQNEFALGFALLRAEVYFK